MTIKTKLLGKKLSNGDAITDVKMFQNIGAVLINGNLVFSLNAAVRGELDVDKAKSLSDFPNEPVSEIEG